MNHYYRPYKQYFDSLFYCFCPCCGDVRIIKLHSEKILINSKMVKVK